MQASTKTRQSDPSAASRQTSATLADWLLILRPRQWTKNFVVFAALLFTGLFNRPDALLFALGAFGVFCALSSVGYIINDAMDMEKDRAHPVKCKRPIAAGRLPRAAAVVYAIVLGLVALAAAAMLGRGFALTAAAYLVVTLTYSFYWKHQVILDLFAITGGFVLRALSGAVVLHVSISAWLFVCVSLLALLLGLGKRRNELYVLEGKGKHHAHRPVLTEYSRPFLNQALAMVSSAAAVTYAVYAIQSPTAAQHPGLVVTVPLVIYGILRYLYLVFHREEGGHPEEMLLADRPLYLTVALWALVVVVVFLVQR